MARLLFTLCLSVAILFLSSFSSSSAFTIQPLPTSSSLSTSSFSHRTTQQTYTTSKVSISYLLIQSNSILFYPILFYPILSYPILSLSLSYLLSDPFMLAFLLILYFILYHYFCPYFLILFFFSIYTYGHILFYPIQNRLLLMTEKVVL